MASAASVRFVPRPSSRNVKPEPALTWSNARSASPSSPRRFAGRTFWVGRPQSTTRQTVPHLAVESATLCVGGNERPDLSMQNAKPVTSRYEP